MRRFSFLFAVSLLCFVGILTGPVFAAAAANKQDDVLAAANKQDDVLASWYRLALQLTRHTPTYSPPVASRSFAYLGVTAFEAVASGAAPMGSFSGKLNGLADVPRRQSGATYDEAVVLDAALSSVVTDLFSNTGPTGQRVMAALSKKLKADVSLGVADDVLFRSQAFGATLANHILTWSRSDGGAIVENMGFPFQYRLTDGPSHWVPTSLIALQQAPLLPDWRKNRPFAMPAGTACALPPPPEYSEDQGSEFYRQAQEVYDVRKGLTPEQKAIARFWSDDPMLSPTPPGHWISIALQVLDAEKAPIDQRVDVLARVGVAIADAFIGCWDAKYRYDLLRPVTYIKRVIDPAWEPLLITPPFPEYPSGHSVQSGAAAAVLEGFFGQNHAFTDATHVDDGMPPRDFSSFDAAAREAAQSRLYGGIHFRSAIDRGLEQGRCIAAYINAIRTRKD